MNDLGKLEKIYRLKWQNKVAFFIICLLFPLCGGGVLYGLFWGDMVKGKDNFFVFLIIYGIGVFCLLTGFWFFYKFFQQRNDNLYLYEKGFVQTYLGNVKTAKWDEIESIYENIVAFVSPLNSSLVYEYTAISFDGRKFVFRSGLKDIEQIGARLKAEVFDRQIPIIIINFNQGETLKFDRFSINQYYIFSEKQKPLPLPTFWKIVIYDGTIQIYQKGDFKIWDSAKYASIPNVPILITILEKFS